MKQAVLAVLVCFFVLVGVGFAQGPMMGPDEAMEGGMMGMPSIPGGKWWQNPEVIAQLKLTADEQAKLDTLHVEIQRKMIDHRGSLEKERLELEQIFEKKEFDETACMNHFKKMVDIRTEMGGERFKLIVEVRKLLGADRTQILKSKFQEKRKERMKEMKGMKKNPSVEMPDPPPKQSEPR